MTTEELLQQGITAARAGDIPRARALLIQVIQADQTSEQGWWWLGFCMTVPDQRAYCFRRVLALNPNHAEAKRQLQEIERLLASAKPAVSQGMPDETKGSAGPTALPQAVSPQAPDAVRVAEAVAPAHPELAANKSNTTLKVIAAAVALLLCLCAIALPALFLLYSNRADQIASGLFLQSATPTSQVVGPAPTRLLVPTLPPAWTPTPTSLPKTPTASPPPRTSTPIVSSTPAPYAQRLAAVQGDITRAKDLTNNGNHTAAVALWSKVIEQAPEFADAYAWRGTSYRYLGESQAAEDTNRDYLLRALNDLNEAFWLNANPPAYYYLQRYEVYFSLGRQDQPRTDQDHWNELALADIRQVIALGITEDWQEREPAFLLFDLGRCQEGLNEINRLIAAEGLADPSAGLHTGLANANLCLGQPEEALKDADIALQIRPGFRREWDRAIVLYSLGHLDEALAQIDQTVAENPIYCGCRYYLRALIHYDQGKSDLALQDLEKGAGETRDVGGLRAYVVGRLALDAGDKQESIAQLQLAEATLRREFGPFLLKRIQKELTALGAQPLSPTMSAPPTATPLPITPVAP